MAKRKSFNGQPIGEYVNGVFYEGLRRDKHGLYVTDPTLPRNKNPVRFGKPDTPQKARKAEARIIRWQREQAARRGDVFHDTTIGVTLRRDDVREADHEQRQVLNLLGVPETPSKVGDKLPFKSIRSSQTSTGTVNEQLATVLERMPVGGKIALGEFWKQLGAAIRRDPREWAKRLGLPELKDLPHVEVQPDVSLDTLLERILNRSPALSKNEQTAVTSAWKMFTKAVGVGTVGEIEEEHVQAYAQAIEARIDDREWTNFDNTVKKNVARVRKVFIHSKKVTHCQRVLGLMGEGINLDAFRAMCAGLGEETIEKPIPTRKEFRALLDAADSRLLKCYALLAANCGFTDMTILDLWRESLHLSSKVPYHNHRRVKPKPTKRFSCLWPETVDALQEYLTHEHDGKVSTGNRTLFFSQDGKPIDRNWLNAEKALWFKRAGVPSDFVMSRFRHGIENIPSNLAAKRRQAVDRYHVDIVMGHVLPKTQSNYYKAGHEPLKYIADYLHEYYYGKKKGKGKK